MKSAAGVLAVVVLAVLGGTSGVASAQLPPVPPPPVPVPDLPPIPVPDPPLPVPDDPVPVPDDPVPVPDDPVPVPDPGGGTPDVPSVPGGSGGGDGSSGGSDGGSSSSGTSASGTSGGSGSSSGGSGSSSGGTGGSGGKAGSAGMGGSAAAVRPVGRAPRVKTKFNRLPRGLEAVLESIELGRHTRANLRRLQRAYAVAPPALRALILRLLRAEIKRLRADGLSAAERKQIRRLRLVLETLKRTKIATPTTTSSSTTGSAATVAGAAETQGAGANGSDLAVPASSEPRPFTGGSDSPPNAPDPVGGESSGPIVGLPSPDSPSGMAVYLALAALLALSLAALALAAAPSQVLPNGRVRTFIRSSRSDLAITSVATLSALTLLFLYSILT